MPRILKQKTLFIVRASWRATKKLLRVMAYSESDALSRAERMKENRGAIDVAIVDQKR